MLLLDLGVLNKSPHKISNKEAIIWSMVWILIAMLFGGIIYIYLGGQKTSEYMTAYLIEKALSIDNLFVFILIFNFFAIPEKYQHKVLFWGIIGAIFMRALFIFIGVELINLTYLPEFTLFGKSIHLNFILFIFGFFLIYAGIKSAIGEDNEEVDYSNNFAIRLVKRFMSVTDKFNNGKFFSIENGKRVATPLFVSVMVIEASDLMFAVDSIPAIFTVSTDPFILYTSNIFAILGLRSLYFLLANMIGVFHYLKYGIAFILTFIGVKMVIADFYKIESDISLIVVALTLAISVITSLVFKKNITDIQ